MVKEIDYSPRKSAQKPRRAATILQRRRRIWRFNVVHYLSDNSTFYLLRKCSSVFIEIYLTVVN